MDKSKQLYSLTQNTDKLKKLIDEYPDYKIAVLAGEDATTGMDRWTYCSEITFDVGEILDCPDMYDADGSIFTDRDRFAEFIEEQMFDEGLEGDALDAAVKAKVAEFEPYWENVIFIMATN